MMPVSPSVHLKQCRITWLQDSPLKPSKDAGFGCLEFGASGISFASRHASRLEHTASLRRCQKGPSCLLHAYPRVARSVRRVFHGRLHSKQFHTGTRRFGSANRASKSIARLFRIHCVRLGDLVVRLERITGSRDRVAPAFRRPMGITPTCPF